MRGEQVDLAMPEEGSLYAPLGIITQQDFSEWPFLAYVYDPSTPSVALFTLAVEKDVANRNIVLTSPDVLPVGLAAGARLSYSVWCKPGAKAHRFFYGAFDIVEGGPNPVW